MLNLLPIIKSLQRHSMKKSLQERGSCSQKNKVYLQQLLQTIIFKTYILKGNGAKLNALQEHDTILR